MTLFDEIRDTLAAVEADYSASQDEIADLNAIRRELEAEIEALQASATTPQHVTVIRNVNFRREPSTVRGGATVIRLLPAGTVIEKLAEVDGETYSGTPTWYKLRDGGQVGYAHNSFFASSPPAGGDVPPFRSPVGDGSSVWGTGWADANPIFSRYELRAGVWAVHTGADLNWNTPVWNADAGAPAVACADGVITYARNTGGAWGNLVVIEHGERLYSRYGHLQDIAVQLGQRVRLGELVGHIGETGTSTPHLHFDISTTDRLATYPQHWPGDDVAGVAAHYVDPKAFVEAHLAPVVTTRSKLGSHVDRWPGDGHLIPAGDFHLINTLGAGPGHLIDVLEANPRAIVIWRDWSTERGRDSGRGAIPDGQGVAAAEQWWAENEQALKDIPTHYRDRVYVQGINEPHDPGRRAADLVAYELRRIELLEGRFKIAALAFAPGQPEIVDGADEWPRFYGLLERLHAGRHMLCLHEYYELTPDELVNTVSAAGRRAGWVVLRYRLIWDKHIAPRGWTNIRIGLGEIGRGGKGWKELLTSQEYLRHLQQMDGWWCEDPEVDGGAHFTHGCHTPADWGGFNTEGQMASLIYEYVASRNQ